jgi:hypothetical protein
VSDGEHESDRSAAPVRETSRTGPPPAGLRDYRTQRSAARRTEPMRRAK